MAEEGGRETFWDVCSHFELGAMTGEQWANMQGAISEEWSDALSPTTLLTCLVGSTRVVGASRQQAARGPTRREGDGESRKLKGPGAVRCWSVAQRDEETVRHELARAVSGSGVRVAGEICRSCDF